MKETAVIVGATGYTGREVVRQCAESGLQTFAHVRPDSSRLSYWEGVFQDFGAAVRTDPWTHEGMATLVGETSPSLVFSLLGTTRKRGTTSGDTYESVDYGLTKLVMDAAMAHAPNPRFVYLSSTGVSPGTGNSYLRARARIEEALRASGMPCTIARPSFITGSDRDDGRLGERAAARLANGLLKVLGLFGGRKMRERYRSTTNVELAAALLYWCQHPREHVDVVESEELRSSALPG